MRHSLACIIDLLFMLACLFACFCMRMLIEIMIMKLNLLTEV
jgi:hypothetical protein